VVGYRERERVREWWVIGEGLWREGEGRRVVGDRERERVREWWVIEGGRG
jgi:hypothetical protein